MGFGREDTESTDEDMRGWRSWNVGIEAVVANAIGISTPYTLELSAFAML